VSVRSVTNVVQVMLTDRSLPLVPSRIFITVLSILETIAWIFVTLWSTLVTLWFIPETMV
jgi:hypothetical protein